MAHYYFVAIFISFPDNKPGDFLNWLVRQIPNRWPNANLDSIRMAITRAKTRIASDSTDERNRANIAKLVIGMW